MADFKDTPWAWESEEEYVSNQATVFRRWALSHGYKPIASQDHLLQGIMGQPQQQQQRETDGGLIGLITKSPPMKGLGWLYEKETKLTEPIRRGIGQVIEPLPGPAKTALGVLGGAAQGAVAGAVAGAPFAGVGAIPGAIGGAVMGGAAGGAYTGLTGKPQDVLGEPFRPSAAIGMIPGARAAGMTAQAGRTGRIGQFLGGGGAKLGQAGKMPEAIAKATTPGGKLARALWLAREPTAERAAQRAAKAQQEAAGISGVLERGLTGRYGQQRAEKMARGLRKGRLPEAEFEPLAASYLPEANRITKADMTALWQDVTKHFLDKGQPHSALNALEGLRDLISIGKLPYPYQQKLLAQVIPELARPLQSMTPLGKRIIPEIMDAAGAFRVIQASLDISYPMRQGIMLLPSHPTLWWKKGMLTGWKTFFAGMGKDVNLARQVALDIEKTADAAVAVSAKGGKAIAKAIENGIPVATDTAHISRVGEAAVTAERAEPFGGGVVSNLIRKIPALGALVRRSEYSFAAASNNMRFGLINNWAQQMAKVSKVGIKELDEIGQVANYATGIGPLPKIISPRLASTIAYAPRYTTSKPAYIWKWGEVLARGYLGKGDPTSRFLAKQMSRDLALFVGSGAAFLAALKHSGVADVEIDPRSSSFGKVRIGKMHMDFWGGWQQYARYITQLTTGQRKTLGTGEIIKANMDVVAGNFLRSKLAPVAGLTADVWLGETYMGEEMKPGPGMFKRDLWNRVAPLAIQDIVEAVAEEKAKGMLSGLALLGVGFQTFETPGQKVARIAKQNHDLDWSELGSVERMRLEAADPAIAAARKEQREAAAKWGSEGSLKVRQQDTDFEANFRAMMARPGITEKMKVQAYEDYNRNRAMASNVYFADSPQLDPRSELEAKLDRMDTLQFPTYGTQEDRDAFYERRDRIYSDPQVYRADVDRHALRFQDPQVQAWVKRYYQARRTRSQWYDIPRFRGLTVEEGDIIQRVISRADTWVEYGYFPNRKTALREMAKDDPTITNRILLNALNAERIRNPQRTQFKLLNRDAFLVFESVELDTI